MKKFEEVYIRIGKYNPEMYEKFFNSYAHDCSRSSDEIKKFWEEIGDTPTTDYDYTWFSWLIDGENKRTIGRIRILFCDGCNLVLEISPYRGFSGNNGANKLWNFVRFAIELAEQKTKILERWGLMQGEEGK